MAKLYDNRLGAGVLVADERVDALIQTGNYSFIKGPNIHLTDEAGELYNVPPENAKAAIEAGYFYAPANVVQEGRLKQEIEETPLQSAGYGLLRGVSFGATDYFGPKRELQLRREMQPGWTAAGEIASLVTPGGLTGLAAKGARNAATAIFKSGIKATQVADKAKRVGSVLNTRVVRGAVGGAAEGAAVGTMYGVSSQLLDDPENYPTFSDHIYAGAGFGAVAGGVIGMIGGVLSGAGGVFKRMRDRAYWRALDPKAKEWRDVTKGGKYVDADTELGRIMAQLDSKDPVTGKRIMENLDDAKELIKEIDNTLLTRYGERIDEIIATVTQAIKRSGQSVDDIQVNIEATARRMMDEIAEPMKGGLQLQAYKAQYRRAVEAIEEFKRLAREKSGGKDTLTFRQAEEIKRIWGKAAFRNKGTPEAQREFMQQMTAIIQKSSEESLEAIAGKLSRIEGFNQSIYAEFLDAKLVFGALNKIRGLAVGAAQRESTNARIPLTSWITGAGLGGGIASTADSVVAGGALGAATFAGTALLRKYAKDSGELLLARGMNRITDYGEMLNSANISQAAIQTSVNALVRGGAAATVKIANPFPDNDKKTVKRFEKLKKDVELLKTNPETLYVRLNEMLPDVQGNQVINQELAQTMANIVGFLSEKMPENTSTSQLLFNNEQVPAMNQILKFMRYVDVLDDPNKILQYVIGGRLMPEHIEAIKTIFPRLHQAQMEAVLNGLTEQGLPLKLDLAQKQSLGRFLGTATDRIFSKKFIDNTQAAYAEARNAQQGGKEGPKLNLPDLATANANATRL